MQDKGRLIILEGFDRTGKDHLLNTFHQRHANDSDYRAYFQVIPEDMPKYREEPEAFRQFLIKHIGKQVDDLVNFKNNGIKVQMLVRLLLTDAVYSTLFSREEVVNRFHQKVFDNFNVENNIFLFKDYNEYLKRLQIIGDTTIEYQEGEFYKVNQLYLDKAKYFETIGATTKVFWLNGEDFLDQFIEEVENKVK